MCCSFFAENGKTGRIYWGSGFCPPWPNPLAAKSIKMPLKCRYTRCAGAKTACLISSV